VLSIDPRVRRISVILMLTFLLTLTLLGTALAHEHRDVGPFTFIVGWREEPALVEQPNGLDLRVMTTADAQPVSGLEQALKADVIYGDKSMPLELRPRFGQPGAYTADIIPTRPGSYIFQITGEISGTQIAERFNSADGKFGDVDPVAALQFPEPVSVASDLEGQAVAATQAADSARLFGLIGLVAGVLGVIVGGVALVRR